MMLASRTTRKRVFIFKLPAGAMEIIHTIQRQSDDRDPGFCCMGIFAEAREGPPFMIDLLSRSRTVGGLWPTLAFDCWHYHDEVAPPSAVFGRGVGTTDLGFLYLRHHRSPVSAHRHGLDHDYAD